MNGATADGRLTLFAVPKPFVGLAAVHQHNALLSWARLGPGVDVILFGDDDGVEGAARRHGFAYGGPVARSAAGTPLLDDLFARAEAMARGATLAYVNADIILFGDFLAAIETARARTTHFLVVGRRRDIDLDEAIDATDPEWQQQLIARARAEGHIEAPDGSDYFVFSRGLFGRLPPFAIGRTGWDNWLMAEALRRHAVLVDASEDVLAIHQRHGRDDGAWSGREAERNRTLAGGGRGVFTIADATLVLREGQFVSGRRLEFWPRRLKAAGLRHLTAWLQEHPVTHWTIRRWRGRAVERSHAADPVVPAAEGTWRSLSSFKEKLRGS